MKLHTLTQLMASSVRRISATGKLERMRRKLKRKNTRDGLVSRGVKHESAIGLVKIQVLGLERIGRERA